MIGVVIGTCLRKADDQKKLDEILSQIQDQKTQFERAVNRKKFWQSWLYRVKTVERFCGIVAIMACCIFYKD